MTDSALDFSMQNVPEGWHEAASDGPEQDYAPLNASSRGKKKLKIAPAAEKVDLVTASIAGIAVSFAGSVLWYGLETRGHFVSPWTAIGFAILTAIAVRLGGTRADPEIRATLSVIIYLIGLLATIFFIERFDYLLTFGESPGLEATEDVFIRDRFTDPMTVAAWAVGVVVAAQVSYSTRRR